MSDNNSCCHKTRAKYMIWGTLSDNPDMSSKANYISYPPPRLPLCSRSTNQTTEQAWTSLRLPTRYTASQAVTEMPSTVCCAIKYPCFAQYCPLCAEIFRSCRANRVKMGLSLTISQYRFATAPDCYFLFGALINSNHPIAICLHTEKISLV